MGIDFLTVVVSIVFLGYFDMATVVSATQVLEEFVPLGFEPSSS